MGIPILERAASNLAAFRANPYIGRAIGIGLDPSGQFLVEWTCVTARSKGSQNRRYAPPRRGHVETELADPQAEKGDPEKTIYSAMEGDSGVYVVSNGRQTDTVVELWGREHGFIEAMFQHTYEDDSISTPRITAVSVVNGKTPLMAMMAILRKSQYSDSCVRNFFTFEDLCPGIGHTLTTYQTDGDPPPIFEGEPFVLPLLFGNHSAEDIGQGLWDALNPHNRVCLAVKMVSLKTGKPIAEPYIINRFAKVEASEAERLQQIKGSIPPGQASPL